MDLASKLAPFSPSPELLFWAEKRVGGLLEQVKTSATEIHWRNAKIEKLTLELACLRRMKFGAKGESMATAEQDLFDETLAADLAPAKPGWPNSAGQPGNGARTSHARANANAPAVSPCARSAAVSSTGTNPKAAPVANVARRWC